MTMIEIFLGEVGSTKYYFYEVEIHSWERTDTLQSSFDEYGSIVHVLPQRTPNLKNSKKPSKDSEKPTFLIFMLSSLYL